MLVVIISSHELLVFKEGKEDLLTIKERVIFVREKFVGTEKLMDLLSFLSDDKKFVGSE